MADERGLGIDHDGYTRAMEVQRERSRSADSRYAATGEWINLRDGVADRFVGHDRLEVQTEVLRYRARAEEEDRWEICLVETPFYAESGGQVGDAGTLESLDGALRLHVEQTIRTTAGITHIARLDETDRDLNALSRGVMARVDPRSRQLAACHHSATHLLHAALHRFVSPSAFQAGSLVSPERLRFDFSLTRPVTEDEIAAMETWVNEQIREALPVQTHIDVPLHEAEAMGAMMIFGEKYGERVRVVAMGGSRELCGGTHVRNTSEIGSFRILSETGVAAGVRRIEAVTSERAAQAASHDRSLLKQISAMLRTPVDQLIERVERLQGDLRERERELERVQRSLALQEARRIAEAAQAFSGIATVAARVEVESRDQLLVLVDFVRDRLGPASAGLLVATLEDRPALVTFCTDGAIQRGLRAGELIRPVAEALGGRGGGRPSLAQAGGQSLEGVDAALAGFLETVRGLAEA
jgi:alanyl-tRNA synthetase